MQQYGWKKNGSVQEWLFAEGYRFDFFQAVRLLEKIQSGQKNADVPHDGKEQGIGLWMNDADRVRLRSRVSFAFPPSEIHDVKRISEEPLQVELIANFLALAGTQGPLPDVFAELLHERVKNRDTGLADFLDIFHHRLLTLMYQVRLQHRLWLEWKAPKESKLAKYIYSFAGLGIPELQNRMRAGDSAVLAYTGMLWQKPRSAIGLQHILENHFGVKVLVRPMVGAWKQIEPDDWTRIGRWGNSQRLGRSAMVGRRFWDLQGKFDLLLQNLSMLQFRDFLPGGKRQPALGDLVQFYTNQQYDYAIRLRLRAEEVPVTRLGESQLGWTSWIKKRRTVAQKRKQITISMSA